MTYMLRAEPAEVAWFRGMLSVAEDVAQRYGLPLESTSIAVGVGDQPHGTSAYKHGYRGPGTREGQRVLELLRGLVWRTRGGCGPWEPVVAERRSEGWMVFAAVDVPVGVYQVVRLDPDNRVYTVYSTVEAPSLDDWMADPVLSSLDEGGATPVMRDMSQAHRVDALPALLDRNDTSRLALV